MRVLDVYKERKHSVVKLGEREFKIPAEYTVDEVERLLELERRREEAEKEQVDEARKDEQLARFWAIVFDQLEVLFQHHQPDVTAEELRKLVTSQEALGILNFYDRYRFSGSAASEEGGQKKNSGRELRSLRRMIAFMVVSGFALSDVRKLYLDEFFEYHDEMLFVLESAGRVKEGTYDKIRNVDRRSGGENTVNLLRKQLFKSLAARNKR